jgi:hypothetical protein
MRVDIITKDFNPEGKYLIKKEDLIKKEADNYIPSILFKQKVTQKERARTVVRRITRNIVNRRLSVRNMSRRNSVTSAYEYLSKADKSATKRKASYSNPPSGRNLYHVSGAVDKALSSSEKRASVAAEEGETITSLNHINVSPAPETKSIIIFTYKNQS